MENVGYIFHLFTLVCLYLCFNCYNLQLFWKTTLENAVISELHICLKLYIYYMAKTNSGRGNLIYYYETSLKRIKHLLTYL